MPRPAKLHACLPHDPEAFLPYAVPWDGEEVVLHWANKDQYYIKTGERFTHYRWDSAVGGRTFKVEFHLTEADLPAGNNKDAKKKFHARQRMAERGATEAEVAATVEQGERFPAKFGRTGFRRNFAYEQEWRGRFYHSKQVEVIAVEEDGWLALTVVVRYY